jgi:excisionase family DNA binding protein
MPSDDLEQPQDSSSGARERGLVMTKTAAQRGQDTRHKNAQHRTCAIYESVEELAREIGISRQSAYAALRNNTIPHIRLGKRYILPKAAIAEWLRNPAAFEGASTPNSLRITGTSGSARR